MSYTRTRFGLGVSLLLMACGGVDAGELSEGTETIGTAQSDIVYTESFETGWGSWTADHHLQCEPGCGLLDWSMIRTNQRAHAGAYSLAGTINGSHDDGTIWIERSVPAPIAKSAAQVKVEFYLYSPTQSVVTWPVVAYAGIANPEVEGDFTIVGQTDQVAGWRKYTLVKTVATGSSPVIWVGAGFGVTWEVTRTYNIDSVTITVL